MRFAPFDSAQEDKIEGKIVEVVYVRSLQDDKIEGKIVEVVYVRFL